MNTRITKEKVIKKITSWGFNKNVAMELVEENYDYAVRKYDTLKRVCECIITIN